MTFVDILERNARERPDDLAFLFLEDGEELEQRITNGELLSAASAVAEILAQRGAPGDRVLILCAPGLEYIVGLFGCFLATRVAVPLYPPETNRLARSLERIANVIESCRPDVLLVDPTLDGFADTIRGLSPSLAGLEWLAINRKATASRPTSSPGGDSAALIQYTSGSTGVPKGVVITHDNLIANAVNVEKLVGDGQRALGGWLPPYHDMGLMGMLLQPLYMNIPAYFMSPLHFLQRPARWVRLLSKYRATVTVAPNFAYELAARKAEPGPVDLSSVTIAFNGAEPIRPDTMRAFTRVFGPSGFDEKAFLPCYGLAEATLIVSGRRGFVSERVGIDDLEKGRAIPAEPGAAARELASSGKVLPSMEARIADPTDGTPLPPRSVGEIWIRGPNVASGYYRADQATQELFVTQPDGLPYLRTGDLGFLREDGELFVTGRKKDLIVIRGRNIYPHDLERVAELAHAHVRKGCVAVFAVDGGEGESIGIVFEAGARGEALAPLDVLRSAVTAAVVAECGVAPAAVVIVEAGSLPKTSSGKLQRAATRRAFLEGSLRTIGDREK